MKQNMTHRRKSNWTKIRRVIASSTPSKPFLHDVDVQEYLRVHSLPIRHKYGMNCFLNAVFDENGAKLAQRTYEEYIRVKVNRKEDPCKSGGADIGLPADESIAAFNRASSALAYQQRDNIRIRPPEAIPPSVLKPWQGESDYDVMCRLWALGAGFTNKAAECMKNHQLRNSKLMSLYSSALKDEINALQASRQEISIDETSLLIFAGNVIGSMIPDEESAVLDFLSKMGSHYWQTIWVGLLKHFEQSYASDSCKPLAVIDEDVTEYYDTLRELVNFTEQDVGRAYDNIKGMIIQANPEAPRDAIIILSCGICLRFLGYCSNMFENVQRADGYVLGELFRKLASESLQDSE